MIPEYTKEQWWEECKKMRPELERAEFEARWAQGWFIANLMGAVRKKNG